MKRATPPCRSVALLLGSRLRCPMRLTLTTANAMQLDDFGPPPPAAPSATTNPPAAPKAAPDALLTLLAGHHPAIRQPVDGDITGHQLAVRLDWHAVHPAGDSDVHLQELLGVLRKSEDW